MSNGCGSTSGGAFWDGTIHSYNKAARDQGPRYPNRKVVTPSLLATFHLSIFYPLNLIKFGVPCDTDVLGSKILIVFNRLFVLFY